MFFSSVLASLEVLASSSPSSCLIVCMTRLRPALFPVVFLIASSFLGGADLLAVACFDDPVAAFDDPIATVGGPVGFVGGGTIALSGSACTGVDAGLKVMILSQDLSVFSESPCLIYRTCNLLSRTYEDSENKL